VSVLSLPIILLHVQVVAFATMPRGHQQLKVGQQSHEEQLVAISKAMSYVLRHAPVQEGLQLREDGT